MGGLAAQRGVKLIVIGDVMLDHYLFGAVRRISPEAPIPVFDYESERYVLGGAGNVTANLYGLGASVHLIARVGDDGPGQTIASLVKEIQNGDNAVCFTPLHGTVTTVKTRVIGNGRQQMLRLDREEKKLLSNGEQRRAIDELQKQLSNKRNGLILSDYGKGVCSDKLCRDVIALCRETNTPVFVDPKGRDWHRYANAELVTPNLKELSDVSGRIVPNDDEAVIKAAKEARERYALKNILVTRSEKGCSFVGAEVCFHCPSRAVEVYDVSGAGDTVIATVAYFRALGIDWHECCELANLAASVVVAKAGTSAVSWAELRDAVVRKSSNVPKYTAGKKLFTLEEALALCQTWRTNGETIVFTNGCFDVFHAGHVDSLTRARALGDRLIVALNSDSSVAHLKGAERPINTQADRAAVLAALACVDVILIFDEDTPERVLQKLRPDVLVKGGDYCEEQVVGRQYAGKVVILPLREGLSSTSIIVEARKRH